ncbi:hypothetical protein FRC10_006627 [Ceratobasidium sp. 414]|nr:hypothetical protein FRC10_006627 [Ceratobasidium sp. 414]
MIIPSDDKKPSVETPADESVQRSPAKARSMSDLRTDLDREGGAQFASLNPYRPASVGEPAPPRYEDVAPSSSSAGPSSRNEKDMQRLSIQSQSSGIMSSTDLKDPMSLAALEASPAFQPDGRFQVSIDAQPSSLPKSYRLPVDEPAIDFTGFKNAPPMNVNIMIVGSRGDVQPYLALGQRLRDHGHTVRLTTHETFRQSVKDAGLRFFNIGGDPHELMSYMVRNPGLMPGFESLTNGDITRKQMMVAEMLERCWRSCYEPDEASEGGRSFAADAIISNPPTFAHIHCAEALGIPLLMTFTMPWAPTTAFPHPLVNIKESSAEPKMTNYLTYGLADMMTWQGLGHTINKFRRKRLALPALSVVSASGLLERCNVPWTFCLSPTLVPKPEDWMNNIDVVGFYFLDLAKDYTPPPELEAFLGQGEPPIYIGFGSIVVKDREEMTRTVLSAVAQSGLRAVISAGWGSLDADIMRDPDSLARAGNPEIFILGSVPHDWLFERDELGGDWMIGTTAIGLRCGKPTIVVPFFGDQVGDERSYDIYCGQLVMVVPPQPWWGAQVHARGAGPVPISPRSLLPSTLAEAFRYTQREEVKQAAEKVGTMIRSEDGVGNGVDSFHRHLPLLNMRCDLDSNRVATWYSRTYNLRLSAFAAQVLAENGIIDINKLELHRPREHATHVSINDPVSGTVAPILGIVGDLSAGVGQLFTTRPEKGIRGSLEGLHQGLKNSPKAYGGTVRESGKISGFRSGMREGGKELADGFRDGFTDLVREPVNGFKRGMQALTTFQAMSVVLKPTAGIVALLSNPVQGAAAATRNLLVKPAKERHATRYAEGLAASKASSEADRQWVLKAFEARKGKWKGKKKAITQGE